MSTQTMTEDTTVFDSDLQAIIDAGRGLATPRPFDASQRFHLIAAPGFEPRVVDLDVARQATAPYPLRKAGKYAVYDAASFVAYVARHATSATELYADPEKLSVLAILDGNGPADPPRGCPGTPGHQTHRCRLVLQSTVAWKKWCGIDHKMLGQTEFAEHVEDRLVDVVDPPAADLLEIAQTLVGTKSADFESTMRLRDGNTTIRFVETTTTKAGQKGQLDVPGTITLALTPGSPPHAGK